MVSRVIRYKLRGKKRKKILKFEKKNEYYGDFSCFLAIKSLGSDGKP